MQHHDPRTSGKCPQCGTRLGDVFLTQIGEYPHQQVGTIDLFDALHSLFRSGIYFQGSASRISFCTVPAQCPIPAAPSESHCLCASQALTAPTT